VGTATVSVEVTGKTATITLDSATLSQTYDGSEKAVTATTNPSGLSYSVSYGGSTTAPTDAGSYAVVATITEPDYVSATNSGTLVVAKAGSVTTVTGGTFAYDGSAHAAVVAVTGAGGLSTTGTPTYSGSCSSAPTTVAEGTSCTASYTYAGDTNHLGSTGSASLTINKAAATISLSGLTQTYDGTAKSATVTTNPGGVSYTVTYAGSTTAPTDAGSYTVVASITDANYSGDNATGTLTINQATPTITVSNTSQAYNGSARSVTVTTVPTGLTYSVTYNGSTTAPTDAGTYPVVVTVNTANYYGTKTASLEITRIAPVITITNLEQTYDGSAKPVTVTITPSGLSYSVTYGGSTTVPSTAGSYEVVATVDTTNYYGTQTATLVILGKHNISLLSGWNLVSFAVNPSSTAIANVLDSIDGHYDMVYAWDASGAHSGAGNWMKYVPGAGFGNTLSTLDAKAGFWIHMTTADTLEVVGAVPETTDISIQTGAGGWNLIVIRPTTAAHCRVS
jgi:hypothetical protein